MYYKMVLSDLTTNLTDWFVLKKEPKEEVKEPFNEPKEESIYIILINNKPYGHYYSKDETTEQLEQVKEHVMSRHFFDFKKNYYWNNLPVEDNTVVKMKLVSVIKDNFVRHDSVEDSIEIINSKLLPLHKQ
jgi:hypothetical protein